METSITVGFQNDEKFFTISIDIIKSYPNSLIYGYYANNNFDFAEKIILDKINYDTFGKIYDVIMGKTKQFEVDDLIMSILDYYGFVNDILLNFQKYLDTKRNEILSEVDNFISGTQKIYIPNCREDYFTFKKFQSGFHIVPIQIICFNEKITLVSIYCCIPIYFEYEPKSKISPYIKDHEGILENGDIKSVTHKMLFTNFKREVYPDYYTQTISDLLGTISDTMGEPIENQKISDYANIMEISEKVMATNLLTNNNFYIKKNSYINRGNFRSYVGFVNIS